MLEHEKIIRQYFTAWLNNDVKPLNTILSENITYSECHGPEYHGIHQVITWFLDWNRQGRVLKWDVKQFIHEENITVVEWYFECQYQDSIAGFDGVSIIEFNTNGKILSIKEFQSKAEHFFPYGK